MSEIVSPDQLRVIAELTEKLTALAQNECKHLCIENYSPQLFARLVRAYRAGAWGSGEIGFPDP